MKENDNKIIDITYKINLGEKARIKKITFTGNKIFKDNKLKSIIVSEEYKPGNSFLEKNTLTSKWYL